MSIFFLSICYGIAIGIALSVDAFMLSLVYGSTFKRKLETLLTAIIVGIFHCVMPLLGFFIASLVFTQVNLVVLLEGKVQLVAFSILVLLGIMMLFKNDSNQQFNFRSIFNKLLFAFSVSIDSFLTGIAFTTIDHVNIFIVSFIFAIVSCILTFISLSLGKKSAEHLLHINLDFYAGILMIILAFITLFI